MSKLSNYIKQGRGRGLKIVLYFSLVFALMVGVLSYLRAKSVITDPATEQFIASVPTFEVKDGVAQDNTVKWGTILPIYAQPLVIDTSIENIALPVPDGFYLTKNAFFIIQNNATQTQRFELSGNFDISPDFAKKALNTVVIISSIMLVASVFISIWFTYLLSVLLTALAGWLFRLSLAQRRVWRLSAITSTLSLICAVIATYFGLFATSGWLLLIMVVINLIVLSRLED